MREIKFRAWMLTSPGRPKAMRHYDVKDLGRLTSALGANPGAPVMQYTGLKDKNGVEIYEGDIVKARHEDGRYDTGEVVYGSKGAFCLHLPKVATGIKTPLLNYIYGMMFAEYDFEVIGTIYENPELLK